MPLRFRPGGVGEYKLDGVITQVETSKCAHCPNMTDIPSRKKMFERVDMCRKCMKLVCLRCAGRPCVPHMKEIERVEKEYYSKMQFAKSLGF